MALTTLSALRVAVRDWLARPGDTTLLTDEAVNDLIILFEAEAKRRLRTLAGEAEGSLTLTAGTATVSLPSDFLELRSARVEGNPDTPIEFVTADQLDSYGLSDTSGVPLVMTVQMGTLLPQLRLAPIPDSAYTVKLRYFGSFTPLGTLVPYNWLLLSHPDAYLFGTLAEAECYVGTDERIPLWLQRRDAAFASINMSGQKSMVGGGSLQIKTDVGNP
jgi:hypothetical protein